jgi:ParG
VLQCRHIKKYVSKQKILLTCVLVYTNVALKVIIYKVMNVVAKINVDIEDEDHIELKLSATRHRTSIKKIVNRLIKNYLKEERSAREAKESPRDSKPNPPDRVEPPDRTEPDSLAPAAKKKESS